MAFGKKVKKGEAVEFTDPHAIRKLRNNTSFMDDGEKEKRRKSREEAQGADFEARQRAVATEQDLIEAMGDPDKDVDTRIPEVPQAGSIEMQKKRKLYEQLVMRENERPDEGSRRPVARKPTSKHSWPRARGRISSSERSSCSAPWASGRPRAMRTAPPSRTRSIRPSTCWSPSRSWISRRGRSSTAPSFNLSRAACDGGRT